MKNFVFLRLVVLLLSINSSAQCWQQIVSGTSQGLFHSLGIQKDGTLWAWGYNANGQLGDGTTINRLVPTQIGTDADWVYIAAGSNSSYAIKQNGTLWAWGANDKGQLSDGTTNARLFPAQVLPGTAWSKVSAGDKFVVAQKSDGTIWSCGLNSGGSLGNPNAGSQIHNLTQISSDTDWMDYVCGYRHTVLIKTNHTVWGFGDGTSGKLATGNEGGYNVPTQILSGTEWVQTIAALQTSMFKKNDGTIWGVGQNLQGPLGIGNYDVDVYSLQQAGTDSDWKSIESGSLHTMALKNNGTLWATGLNSSGQLGNGTVSNTNVFVQIGTATNWAKVRCGRQHTLALDANGTLWAWGKNDVGQLGDGTTTDRLVPTQIGTVCNLSTPEFEKTTVRLLTNPVDDLVQLSFSKDGVKKIELFNSLGVLLATKTVLGDFISFEVSGYASGVYFVKCTMDDLVETVKFVKR